METKEQHRERYARWVKTHREEARASRKKWRHENREKHNAGVRAYRLANLEKERLRHRIYREKNTGRIQLYNKNLHENYKRAVINAYGGFCKCCGENDITFLTLEHENRNGKTHRKVKGVFYLSLIRRRFPKDEGLSVLCMNCNWATRLGRKCPHQKAVMEIISAN